MSNVVDLLKSRYPTIKLFVIKRSMGKDKYSFYFPVVTNREMVFGGREGQITAISGIKDLLEQMSSSGAELSEEEIWRSTIIIPLAVTKDGEEISNELVPKKIFIEAVEDWLVKMGIFVNVFEPIDDINAKETTISYMWGGYNYVITLPLFDMEYIESEQSSDDRVKALYDVIDLWMSGNDIISDEKMIEETASKIKKFIFDIKRSINGVTYEKVDNPDSFMLINIIDQLIKKLDLFSIEYEII